MRKGEGRLKRSPSEDENEKDDKNDGRCDNSSAPANMKTPPSKNSSKQSQRGEASSTCSSDVSTAATSTALSTPFSTASETGSSASHHVELDRRREQLYYQMMALMAANLVTFSAVIFSFVPCFMLLAFGVLAVSTGALSYTAYRRLLLEFQQIVSGDGFVAYLPESVGRQLTQATLHEYLSDDTFVREWAFLTLYFIPGLTQEQREAYLQRLAPRHQEFLQRRGLAHLLGDGFMRILIGDNRWRPRAIEATVGTIEHPSQPAGANRRLDFDSDVEVIDDSSHEASTQAPREAHDASSSGSDDDSHEDGLESTTYDEDRERQLDIESDLVVSAAFDGAWSYFYTVVGYANQYAFEQVVEPTSSLLARVGIGASFLALGVGYWGVSTGHYSRPHVSAPTTNMLPSSRTVWSTAVIGGVSAGVLLYARSAYRRMLQSPPPDGDSGKKTEHARK